MRGSAGRLRGPALAAALAIALAGCADRGPVAAIPELDLTTMEAAVAMRLAEARAAVEAAPRSAGAWGTFGMVCHVHDLLEEAAAAYRQAVALDPDDVRWHYYLGDVLFTLGTELETAETHLRRAVALEPSYPAARMRLARVLVARGEPGAAEAFERALELDPDILPARVGLAQVRLGEGRIDEAVALLEGVLERQPRNSRALNALAQAYQRQGRPDAARAIAERAGDAADYNLFSDPLMAKVVAEGASSTLLWERAKAYLEDGNYPQAILGLERVVRLLPDNPGVRHQLALAYRESGELERAAEHLGRAVELEPEHVESRVQLAGLLLELGRPDLAAEHLRRAEALRPEDPEIGWLLARALLRRGDAAMALAVLAATEHRAAGRGETVPVWTHNDWGSALAQQGRFEEAIGHFRAALEIQPADAQTLFHLGLALEGLGRPAEAARYYREAMRLEPNELIASRLDTLGRSGL